MNKQIKILFLLLISLGSYTSNAQEKTIAVKAQAAIGGKIKLRWVIVGDTLPQNSGQGFYIQNVWDRYRDYGFIIERRVLGSTTVERRFTARPDFDKLTEGENDPNLTKEEKDACHAMKTGIFGSKDELYGVNASKISPQIEVNNRLFGTMTASAITFKGACHAGLGIVDDNVQGGTIYEYTIKESNSPDNSGLYQIKVEIDNTVLVTQGSMISKQASSARTASGQRIAALLQAPPVPKVRFRNKSVELKWRWQKPGAVNSHQDLYYGYYIERKALLPTTQDTAWTRLNKIPFTSATASSDTIVYIDTDTTKANSVLKNGKKYSYRLKGKTYFDDEVPSLVITGQCEDDTRYYPTITKDTLFPTTNTVELRWKIPTEAPMYKFKKFAIGRVNRIDSNVVFPRIPIIGGATDKTIDSTKRIAIVNHDVASSTKTAYYVVIGIDKDDKEFLSFPILVQGVDTLAPAAPTNVAAVWNETKKTATITWTPNTESDLLGYKIFRCLPGGTPTAISDTAINKTTIFVDTVKIENLKVLYHIVAMDKQFNPSAFSIPATLQRPDTKPPIRPTFGKYKVNTLGQIELALIPSPSGDVASHNLRRIKDSVSTTLQSWVIPSKPASYLDNSITKGGTAIYIIEAVDSTGNKGSDTLQLDIPSGVVAKPQFTILNSNSSRIDPSITLQWEYNVSSSLNDVAEFVVLKSDMSADPTGKLGTWKTLDGAARQISDYDISYERTYKYGVKAVFKDGSSSAWVYTTLTMPTVCGAVKYLEEVGKVEPGSTLEKEACSSIRLRPGFHAKRNSVFHAVIKKK
jgi:uncharacterized protein